MKEFASKGYEVLYASRGNSLKHDALVNTRVSEELYACRVNSVKHTGRE